MAAIANPCLGLHRNWGIEIESAVQMDTAAPLRDYPGGRAQVDVSKEHSFLQRV